MATHDYVIANQSGAAFRTDLNNALAAIVSNNSNSSSPATTYAYQWWADTSAGTLKIRNSANNAWIELLQLDGTLTLEDGSASTPALAFRDDLNTGIFSSAADTFNVATAGVERMELGATTIFNEDGADVDFRIEGDTEANLFYVDAGNNRIGIGTSSPNVSLEIIDAEANIRLTSDANGLNQIQFGDASDTIRGNIVYRSGTAGDALCFNGYNNTERMRIDSSGNVGIGVTTVSTTFHVKDSVANNVAIFESGDTIVNIAFKDNATSTTPTIGAVADDLKLTTSDVNRITVKSTGNVGIGEESPGLPLHVKHSTSNGILKVESGDSNCGITIADSNGEVSVRAVADILTFNTSSSETERMRIDDTGRVMIGTTTNSMDGVNGDLNIANDNTNNNTVINCSRNTTSDRSQIRFSNPNGNVGSITTSASATSFNTSSDYRLKENEVAISDGITRLKQLKAYKFNFKTDSSTILDGFFAHEVSSIVPQAITGTKDAVVTQAMIDAGDFVEGTLNNPIHQNIDHSKLVPLLVAAVQELITKVETLEAA